MNLIRQTGGQKSEVSKSEVGDYHLTAFAAFVGVVTNKTRVLFSQHLALRYSVRLTTKVTKEAQRSRGN